MENADLQIIETHGVDVIEAQQRAEYDIQITTAKKYPRDLKRVQNNCIAIVSMDKETAETCRYALPRGGKKISGPSVHLARILAQQYGNLRVDSRIKQTTDTQIISEAVCFDLETNYACKVEVRRSILQNEYKDGKPTGRKIRMNEDMIVVTGNAANAIAFRNAVYNVIPKGVVNPVYDAAIKMITGDLSDEQKLITARKKAIEFFNTEYNITTDQILKTMGLRSENQIKASEIVDLRSMRQAIKDGDSTIEEMFGLNKKPQKSPEEKKQDLKDKNANSKSTQPTLL